MRRLSLIVALSIAGPASAAAVVSPDPFTVSGRFELLKAGAPYAGRLRVAAVRLDPSLASQIGFDPAAVDEAVRAAAVRSFKNFGYEAETDAEAVPLDLELLPVAAERAEGGLAAVARIQVRPAGEHPCLVGLGEGRFTALDRKRSGAGKRALLIGSTLGLALLPVNGSSIADLAEAGSPKNQTLNRQRSVSAGEGVSPVFGDLAQRRFGLTSAVQLALADYIRQLGENPACKAAG